MVLIDSTLNESQIKRISDAIGRNSVIKLESLKVRRSLIHTHIDSLSISLFKKYYFTIAEFPNTLFFFFFFYISALHLFCFQLQGNDLGENGVKILAKGLQTNTTIKTLDLQVCVSLADMMWIYLCRWSGSHTSLVLRAKAKKEKFCWHFHVLV